MMNAAELSKGFILSAALLLMSSCSYMQQVADAGQTTAAKAEASEKTSAQPVAVNTATKQPAQQPSATRPTASNTAGNALRINNPKYGRITADKSSPKAGEQVALTVHLPADCELASLSVADSKGNLLSVSADGSFVMPSGTATVSAQVVKPDNTDMVAVKGATIEKKVMASPSIFHDKVPLTVNDYYICDHPITQGEWERYMTYYGVASKGTEYGQSDAYDAYKPKPELGIGKDYPVYYVSPMEVIIYCNLMSMAQGLEPCYYDEQHQCDPKEWAKNPAFKIATDANGKYYVNDYVFSGFALDCNEQANGYRILSEAEWEYAAREGNDGFKPEHYKITTWDRETYESTRWADGEPHPIKQKAPNALGIYDLMDNQAYTSDGVLRGGQAYPVSNNYTVRARYTFNISSDTRNSFGFRLVRTKKQPKYVVYQ